MNFPDAVTFGHVKTVKVQTLPMQGQKPSHVPVKCKLRKHRRVEKARDTGWLDQKWWWSDCGHAPLPDGCSQLTNQITMGPHVLRVPVPRHRAWPVCVAFMMLCRQDYIPVDNETIWTKEMGSGPPAPTYLARLRLFKMVEGTQLQEMYSWPLNNMVVRGVLTPVQKKIHV